MVGRVLPIFAEAGVLTREDNAGVGQGSVRWPLLNPEVGVRLQHRRALVVVKSTSVARPVLILCVEEVAA